MILKLKSGILLTKILTHCDLVTSYIVNALSIGSGYELAFVHRRAITWASVNMSIGILRNNFSAIWENEDIFSEMKMHLKMSSEKCRVVLFRSQCVNWRGFSNSLSRPTVLGTRRCPVRKAEMHCPERWWWEPWMFPVHLKLTVNRWRPRFVMNDNVPNFVVTGGTGSFHNDNRRCYHAVTTKVASWRVSVSPDHAVWPVKSRLGCCFWM